jgi:exo-beta-1,3-glucanase (GH17 family)/cellulose synthase/poly-beta-1,6-N-acetylglucosamine synthase-like glycosyltransferase
LTDLADTVAARQPAATPPAHGAAAPDSAVQAPPAPDAPRPRALARWAGAPAIAAFVLALNWFAWSSANAPLPAPDAPARAAGLAYNAFQRHESPLAQRFPTDDELREDVRLLATMTGRLRTYSSAEFPQLPAIAAERGLKVAAGVWLDRRFDNNEREIDAAIDSARRHRNVERVIVGNETQLHGKLSPAELHAYLDRVRAAVRVPVSTAEPWHVWLRQPELARHVDFITVHLLPYWEGVPVEAAVDETLRRLAQVRARFPKKRVVIGEIGWPSGGEAVGVALATPERQAQFVRTFLARAEGLDLDYYLMEAVDQPWKRATEGAVGAHWGVLDAARRPKFDYTGPVFADPYWQPKAALASLLGLAAMLPFLLAFPRMRAAGRLAFALSAQGVASFAVLLLALPLADYLGAVDTFVLLLLAPGLAMMAAILLAQVFEFAEMFWDGSLHRRAAQRPLAAGARPPFVSVHLACSNEPPEMVIATVDSLLALDWPHLEIVVVDNNTRDATLWRPVQAHVEMRRQALAAAGRTAPNLRFFHLPELPGFKAGALNFALAQTDPRAEWIGVVDADYVVRPDWLRAVAGWFEEAGVGIVQAPQAHRDWGGSLLRRMMNWEYEGFFRVGMHHRHERDAIIQHGTMTLIRRDTLEHVGAWSPECICEDSELGLRVLAAGQRAVYVDQVFGTGLVPADFAAFSRQRRRWAEGAMQILRRHAGALFGPSPLALGQRYHFVAGWLPWIGDALHLLFSVTALAWTLGIVAAPQYFSPPTALFVVPLAVFFLVRAVLGPLLYWRRVPCRPADIAGASLAGMALSHSVARGVLAGLAGRRAVFAVTRKAAAGTRRAAFGAREEAALLVALAAGIAATALARSPGDVALAAWMAVLAMQALPYAAAVAVAAIPQRFARRRRAAAVRQSAQAQRP